MSCFFFFISPFSSLSRVSLLAKECGSGLAVRYQKPSGNNAFAVTTARFASIRMQSSLSLFHSLVVLLNFSAFSCHCAPSRCLDKIRENDRKEKPRPIMGSFKIFYQRFLVPLLYLFLPFFLFTNTRILFGMDIQPLYMCHSLSDAARGRNKNSRKYPGFKGALDEGVQMSSFSFFSRFGRAYYFIYLFFFLPWFRHHRCRCRHFSRRTHL